MTTTAYYTLFALELATLTLLVVPPVVKFFRLVSEGEKETEAAKQRIAARQAAKANLPAVLDGEPDPPEET